MKQMYKVFINDQEISFESLISQNHKIKAGRAEFTSVKQLVLVIKKSGLKRNIRFFSSKPFRDFQEFTKHFRTIKAAGGLVNKTNSSDKILMIFRLGKWDLPKGKIDKGEGVKTAAQREVEEECGIGNLQITEKLKSTYHLYQNKGEWVIKQTSWFRMETSDKKVLKPQAEEGVEKAEWVSIKKLPEYLPLSYASIASLVYDEILSC